MTPNLRGREITIEPLKGESDFERELRGWIEGIVVRRGQKRDWEYYLVKLKEALVYQHPVVNQSLRLEHLLVFPDGTQLDWAYTGEGPPGMPVLIKVFGVLPETSKPTDYSAGEIFLLARAVAKASHTTINPNGLGVAMTIDELVTEFIDCAAKRGAALEVGDLKTANARLSRLAGTSSRLMEQGDEGRRALLGILMHADPWVQIGAATFTIDFAKSDTLAVLRQLSQNSTVAGITAKLLLGSSQDREPHSA
jgi:hypothetical protein